MKNEKSSMKSASAESSKSSKIRQLFRFQLGFEKIQQRQTLRLRRISLSDKLRLRFGF